VRKGNAFPCFCRATESKQDVLEKRETEGIQEKDPCRDLSVEQVKQKLSDGFAIRLRSKGDGTKSQIVVDLFKGEREVKENEKDIILLKRNGIPPYALAHMVDDILMRTSKVIRGEDWYSSLPAHIELFELAGFKPIQYGHNPLICTIDATTGNKRKLSKRLDPHADMRYYAEVGYPIEAVHEYLLTLANSDFEMWRIANPDKSYWDFPFSLDKVGSNNPIFDLQKLDSISKNIIAKKTCKQINKEVAEFFKDKNIDLEKIYKILAIDRETDKPRKDIAKYSDILTEYDFLFDVPRNGTNDVAREYAKTYKHGASIDEWNAQIGKNKKQVRLALTGKESGPDLYEIMQILGEQEVKKRLLARAD
jgi:glutamyl-tRNA synthetase